MAISKFIFPFLLAFLATYCFVIYFSFFHGTSTTDGNSRSNSNQEILGHNGGSDLLSSSNSNSNSNSGGGGVEISEGQLSSYVDLFDDSNTWLSSSCAQYIEEQARTKLPKPTVSVIITTRNENIDTLILTIASAYSRSEGLLKHIVIVDDQSDIATETYFLEEKEGSSRWKTNPKVDSALKALVKVVRTPSKLGIAGSKDFGAEFARNLVWQANTRWTLDQVHEELVFVFLDSHTIASDQWLVPLLATLEQYPKAIVYPAIDVMLPLTSKSKLSASVAGAGAAEANIAGASRINVIKADNVIGSFDWSLSFKWEPIDDSTIAAKRFKVATSRSQTTLSRDSVVASPAAPGIFAIKASFYSKMGGFDKSISIWSLDGLDSIEFSLRVWMCGGLVLRQPCSRVAHSSAYNTPLLLEEVVSGGLPRSVVDKNVLSIAERYMRSGKGVGDHKETVYQARFINRAPLVSPVHLSFDRYPANIASIDIIAKESCQDFDWYLQEVFPGLLEDEISVRNKFQKHLLQKDAYTARQDLLMNQYSKGKSDIVIDPDEVARLNRLLTDNAEEMAIQKLHNSHVPPVTQYIHPNNFKVKSLRKAGEIPQENIDYPIGDSNSNNNKVSVLLPKLDVTVSKLPETDSHEAHANLVRMNLICIDESNNPNLVPDTSLSKNECGKATPDYCEKNKYYMMFGCPVSCGWCSSDGKLCIDFYEKKCIQWKAEGRCDSESDLMHHICRQSCGICSPDASYKSQPAVKITVNSIKAAAPLELHKDSNDIHTLETVDPYTAQRLFKAGSLPDKSIYNGDACSLNGKSHGELLSRMTVYHKKDENEDGGGSNTHDQVKPVKIFCGIYTMLKNHETNVKSTRDTWGKRCDGFVAFSTDSDKSIPALKIEHEGEEAYDNMWQKSRSIWKYIANHFMKDFDFFLLGGDDMFYIIENLRLYLGSSRIQGLVDGQPGLYIGRRFWPKDKRNRPVGGVFNGGGPGYLLDRKALALLRDNIDSPKCYPHQRGFWEDVNVANCLNKTAGIEAIDTRDERGGERFNPFSPGVHLTYRIDHSDKQDWYPKFNPYLKEGLDCCAKEGISFHYIASDLLRQLSSYLYVCENKIQTSNFI